VLCDLEGVRQRDSRQALIVHSTTKFGLRRSHDETARRDSTPAILAVALYGNVLTHKAINGVLPTRNRGASGIEGKRTRVDDRSVSH
jgi:hypothetical protein